LEEQVFSSVFRIQGTREVEGRGKKASGFGTEGQTSVKGNFDSASMGPERHWYRPRMAAPSGPDYKNDFVSPGGLYWAPGTFRRAGVPSWAPTQAEPYSVVRLQQHESSTVAFFPWIPSRTSGESAAVPLSAPSKPILPVFGHQRYPPPELQNKLFFK